MALIGPKEAPLMPLTFWPKGQPSKKFNFNMTPDTGASISLMAENVAKKQKIPIDPSKKITVRTASEAHMNCSGGIGLTCQHRVTKSATDIEVKVSNSIKDEIIVSYQDLLDLKVIEPNFPMGKCKKISKTEAEAMRQRLIEEFSDVLQDELPDTPMNAPPVEIKLKDGPVRPIQVTRARPVELHFQEKAYELIKKLAKKKIISEVREPTTWVSPAKFVPKSNGVDVRLTTNFQQLNKFIERPVHPFLSAQDTIRQISPDARVFGTLDAVMGYFQLALAEESSLLTTFLTPYGKYRYNRSPMRCNASQDWWNRVSDELIIDFQKWSAKIVDDIMCWASNLEELHQRMRLILLKCREKKITISLKKLQVGEEVTFAGYRVSAKGIKPDPAKVKALAEFPTPTDVTSLRAYIGLANQLGAFIPDLSQCLVKMRSLLQKRVVFLWTPDIDKEFERSKRILTSDAMVKPFNPELPTGLLTDASRLYGLGYILLQWEDKKTRIIQCGSFALTPAQKNYATIELEFLAIVRALLKCKFYLHGPSNFKVITDHKPLVGIMSKDMGDLHNNRLARMREKTAQFTFEIEWTAGKYHDAADALSRFPVFEAYDDEMDSTRTEEEAVIKRVAEDPRVLDLAKAAQEDPDYGAVVSAFCEQIKLENLPFDHPAKPYKSVWGNISLVDTSKGRILAMDGRVVIPTSKRKETLAQLHRTHQGIKKSRLAARETVFWSGISSDIKSMVEGCEACQKFCPSQAEEHFQSVLKEVTAPLELVSTDIYELKGKQFRVIADAYSGFVEVKPLRHITSADVVKALEEFFSLVGYPKRIRSDNGRQLVSEETKLYLRDNGIVQETSSPEFPSSNGHAEVAVKVAKMLQKKCQEDNSDFSKALAELQRQPRSHGEVPSYLFFRRKVRGNIVRQGNDKNEIVERQKLRLNENPSARELKQLEVGQIVRVQNQVSKTWERKAKVLQMCDFGRSYKLQSLDDDEVQFRRNRKFLKPVAEPGAEPTAECTEDKSADNTVDRDRAEKNRPTDYEEQQTQQVRRSARLIEKRKTAKDVS